MAVYTSAKSTQHNQILQLKCKWRKSTESTLAIQVQLDSD